MEEKPPICRSLVKTLLELHNTSGSGVVRVERGKEKKQLVVRHGSLAFAESNVQDDHLALVLVRMHLLPRTALGEIAALMKAGKTSDHAVLEVSALTWKEINDGAREQAAQILASLFGWNNAELRCYSADVTSKRQIDLGYPIPELLVVSARHAVAHRTIPSSLKKLSGSLGPNMTSAADLALIPLDGAEAMAYSFVNQTMAYEHILREFSISGVRTEELLQRLLLIGFLHLQDSAADKEDVDFTPNATQAVANRLDQMLLQFEAADFYEILGVAPGVPDSEIKSSYHELARLYHPDRFQSKEFSDALRTKAERVFTYVTSAYRTLGDPARRASYDADRLRKDSHLETAMKARSAIDLEREKMAVTLYRSGRTALTRHQFEKAVEQLKECVWLRPDVGRYQLYLGAAQAEIPKMRKEAEQHLLKAIELDCMQPQAYLILGKLYLIVGLPRRAEQQFREVLRWDPSNTEAQRLLEQLAAPGGDQGGTHPMSKRR